jgi:hypothetical protein
MIDFGQAERIEKLAADWGLEPRLALQRLLDNHDTTEKVIAFKAQTIDKLRAEVERLRAMTDGTCYSCGENHGDPVLLCGACKVAIWPKIGD